MVDTWAVADDLTTDQTPDLAELSLPESPVGDITDKLGAFNGVAANEAPAQKQQTNVDLKTGNPAPAKSANNIFLMMAFLTASEAAKQDNFINHDTPSDLAKGATNSANIVSNTTPIVARIPEETISGDFSDDMRAKIVAEARSHIGKTELGGNNMGAHVDGFLGEQFRNSGLPWCAGFCSTVLNNAMGNTIDHTLGAKDIMRQAQRFDAFHTIDEGYTPKPGDIVVFERVNTGDAYGHVEVVTEVSADGSFKTVGGNTTTAPGVDGVNERSYAAADFDKKRLLGFANPVEMYAARNGIPTENLDNNLKLADNTISPDPHGLTNS